MGIKLESKMFLCLEGCFRHYPEICLMYPIHKVFVKDEGFEAISLEMQI